MENSKNNLENSYPYPQNGSRKRILVVDDNKDLAFVFGRLLEALDHKVKVVNESPTALDVALDFQPDIIFLDIAMPHMDGCEVAQQLRQDGHFNKTLLVALTGYGHAENRKRCYDSGFDKYCVKPIDIGEIKKILST